MRDHPPVRKQASLLWRYGAAALLAGTGLGGSQAARADIAVAIAGPLTGSNAAVGEQLKKGAEQAVKDINAAGGVLGEKLVLTEADDACDPKQAEAVANQLASKGVVFVDGHFCSSSSIPASAVYADAGILQISPASTNPKFTDDAAAKGWMNVYRVCGRDDQQGSVAAKFIEKNFAGKNIAILDDKSTYGKGLADVTRQVLNADGVKEVDNDEITAGDSDFTAVISKLKAAKVDLIYFGGYPREGGLIVRQAHDQGLQAVLMGGDALQSNDFWSITGPVGEGTLFTFASDPMANPAAKATVEEFKAAGYNPEGYTLYSYAAFQIFAQAAKEAGSIKLPDLAKVMHAKTFDTVAGPLTYDKKGDRTVADFVPWHWHSGATLVIQ